MRALTIVAILLTQTLSAQKTGIGTHDPAERLDVAEGSVRIRTISTNIGNSSDRAVVADKNGVLKTADPKRLTFHSRLSREQNIASETTLLFSVPLVTSELYTYQLATGVLTFKKKGNYLINLQGAHRNTSQNASQLLFGIRPEPNGPYLARGSAFSLNTSTVSQIVHYTTVISVEAGQKVRFTANGSGSGTILEQETGATGTGNTSNVTIQKI